MGAHATSVKQVFINHAIADADFAQRLAGDLKGLGVQVWLVIAFVALATLLAACVVHEPVVDLEGSEWVLTSLNGEMPLKGTQISLAFQAGSAGGFAGCNGYGGPYKVDGNNLSIEEIASTAQGCLEPEGVMDQEGVYLDALLSVTAYQVVEDRLELADGSGDVKLVYTRQRVFAGDPADLVGTEWRLVTLDGSPLDEEMTATIAFEADRYSGLAGCRHFEGDYQAGNGEIGFLSTSMLEAECPGAGDDYYAREGRFTDSLTWAQHWRVRDGQLEIHTARGEVLVFEAVE